MIDPERIQEELIVRFRVADVFKDKKISVYAGDNCIQSQCKKVLAPGEMEQVRLKKEKLLQAGDFDNIMICLEDA